MASIISASNVSSGGLIQTGDSSGVLQLQTGANVPALTLNTTGAFGVGSGAAYGSAGQVLTSAGSGAAPTWATAPAPTSLTNTLVTSLLETATITAAAPSSTTNFDFSTQAVQYYTSNASTNWTLNVRGNSTTSLNSIMTTGQSATIALMVTNGGTAYYQTAMTIDGASVTPKWQGGTAPSSGNTSAVDIYSFVIVKTGSAAFTVFASRTKFA